MNIDSCSTHSTETGKEPSERKLVLRAIKKGSHPQVVKDQKSDNHFLCHICKRFTIVYIGDIQKEQCVSCLLKNIEHFENKTFQK